MALIGEERLPPVAVLCGGPGAEREVSLASGKAIAAALAEAGASVRLVVLEDAKVDTEALAREIVFIALHGEFGEDGTLQRICDEAGLCYTGSPAAACALAMDKHAAKLRLRQAGIPTPSWTRVESTAAAASALAEAGLPLPVVVKPNNRGSSVGVTIVRKLDDLEPAVAQALAIDCAALLEEFIPGREVTAGMLGGEILPLIELAPDGEFYDYRAKYISDRTRYLCPAPVAAATAEEVRRIVRAVNRVLGIEHFSRTDLILGQTGPQVLELNAIPGFTSHSLLPKAAQAAGISFSELCLRIVRLAWARAKTPRR